MHIYKYEALIKKENLLITNDFVDPISIIIQQYVTTGTDDMSIQSNRTEHTPTSSSVGSGSSWPVELILVS